MKTRNILSSIATVATMLASSAAGGVYGTEITISDNNSSGSGWYGNHEDNETETNPDTLRGQNWDLEGAFQNGKDLTLIGGYDFKNGVNYGGHNYRSGDIFIDIDGNAVYGQAANGGSRTGGTTTNLFGYDYVLDLDFSTMTYDLVRLVAGSVVNRGLVVASSNPWRYSSGGVNVAGFQDVAFSYFGGLTNAGTGMQGYNGNNSHYGLTVDLSFLGNGADALIHYTMECGNDNLVARAHVPDSAATLSLLGLSLLGSAAARRRLIA